jgi:hypothetical protein
VRHSAGADDDERKSYIHWANLAHRESIDL